MAVLGAVLYSAGGSAGVAPASEARLSPLGRFGLAVSEESAHVSLRSALRRLGAQAPGVVRADACDVALAEGIDVDLHDRQVLARRLLERSGEVPADMAAGAVESLRAELLPGWYEDWVLLEAENWRQSRLHALEAAAGVLAGAARFGEAVVAAQAAVAADPLRESPHAALIAVHMSEGNQSEAVREFEHYRGRLKAALGVEPTERLRALLPG